MSDIPTAPPSFTPPGSSLSPVTVTAILGALQNLVQATYAEASAIKSFFGAGASGDISGSYPGPITVAKTNGVAFGPYATALQGQLPGIATNTAAPAGDIGQEVEGVVAIGSAAALTTGAGLSVTSIPLTAGDWDVWGYIGFTGGTTTTVNLLRGSISLVNNTLDSTRGRWASQVPAGATTFNTLLGQQFACGQDQIKLAAPATIFLVADADFAVSTCSAFGTIIARRRH